MKKLIVLTLCAFCASLAQAESMQFVTLLSQPVGSFAKVKLLDANTAAEIKNLNYCQPSLDGTIDIASGGMKVDKLLDVKTMLGGDVGIYDVVQKENKGGEIRTQGPEGTQVLTGQFLKTTETMQGSGTYPLKINANDVTIQTGVTSKVASFNTMDLKNKAVLKKAAVWSVRASQKSMGWVKHTKEGCAGADCSPALLMGNPAMAIAVQNPGWSIDNPGLIVDGVLNQQVTTTKPNVSVLP